MSFTDIKKAIVDGDLNRVKALVKAHPEIVNITNSADETPLYMATYYGDLPIVEYLVDNGADIEKREIKAGWTALHISINFGYTNVFEYLINQGADWNKKTNYEDTPLINACRKNKDNNNLEIIKMLLILGADVNAENVGGHTALSYAEEKNDEIVVQLLRDVLDANEPTFTLDIIPVNRKKIPKTAEDFVQMDDVNIDNFLAENDKNKIIKLSNSFYAISGNDIKTHFLSQSQKNNYIYYPCKKALPPPALGVSKNDVHMDKPLFSASYLVGVLSDFILLNEVKAMLKSENQYFEIIPSEFEDIPATASAQMLTANANAVSANHCQEGKAAKILKLKMINIVEDAEEAAVVKSLSKSLSKEGTKEAKAESEATSAKKVVSVASSSSSKAVSEAAAEAEGRRKRRNKRTKRNKRNKRTNKRQRKGRNRTVKSKRTKRTSRY
jgi:ankyrin repeat protein